MAESVNSALATSSPARPFLAIGVGGLIVGALDLLYAILVYSPHHPGLIPQVIASGLLGRQSFRDGNASVALGVLLQFVIALGAATVYYLASRKLKFLVHRAVLCGMAYGAAVFIFMHLVVLPLSAAPLGHMTLIHASTEFVQHWFVVGLPIALSVRHYSP
ncbi:MAG: hypothetical protein WAN10_05440 [Candidatus Acidiferrales bacterium]